MNSPGIMRWWDGSAWTDHTMSSAAPSPPAPQPKVRPDGTLRGPSFRAAMLTVLAGVVVAVASAFVVVPAFVDSVSGPRFGAPGSTTLSLGEGRWVIYERTGWSSGADDVGGGFEFPTDVQQRSSSVWPQNVTVEGPAPVEVRSDRGGVTQTITRGEASYTGAVRFDIEAAGEYRISIERTADTEVLVARPITDLLGRWPWLVAFVLGGITVVVGLVLWGIGAANRRLAKRAGYPPA